jgi:ubiquinone/menaquinone biosynthesis C-methylase UbiE
MGTVDVYRITNQLDDATLDVLVTRLEARGKHPRFADMLREYLDAMAIDSARSVLDLGAIARRPEFSGCVTGIDRSPHLIGAAAHLAHEEGIGEKAQFRAGDSHTLELRDAEFDAVVAHTLFSHLDDPRVVLTEIVRVLKPGGKVGIFDGDYASLTFPSDDPVAGRRLTKPSSTPS